MQERAKKVVFLRDLMILRCVSDFKSRDVVQMTKMLALFSNSSDTVYSRCKPVFILVVFLRDLMISHCVSDFKSRDVVQMTIMLGYLLNTPDTLSNIIKITYRDA